MGGMEKGHYKIRPVNDGRLMVVDNGARGLTVWFGADTGLSISLLENIARTTIDKLNGIDSETYLAYCLFQDSGTFVARRLD